MNDESEEHVPAQPPPDASDKLTWAEQAERMRQLCSLRLEALTAAVRNGCADADDVAELVRLSSVVRGFLTTESKKPADPASMTDDELRRRAK